MKKAVILFTFICLVFISLPFFRQNNIYEINQKGTFLELKSDYTEKISAVKENGSAVYFEIKNAKLSDELKTGYTGEIGIVAQQIGSKVRIYLNGDNSSDYKLKFIAKKGVMPFNFNLTGMIFTLIGLFIYVAMKFCSATIKLTKDDLKVTTPVKTAVDLNRQFYTFGKRKSPEIVLNTATNPVRQGVYDFQYAKDKKNIKIAI